MGLRPVFGWYNFCLHGKGAYLRVLMPYVFHRRLCTVAAMVVYSLLSTLPGPAGACGRPSSYIIKPRLLGNHVVGELRVGAGVACYRDGGVGPPAFLGADIGKRGVPTPTKADSHVLRQQFAHVAPQTLRFLNLPLAHPHLVVFHATPDALCDPDYPPFKDLTGSCMQYYMPLEYMDRTTTAPDRFGC